MMLTPLHLPSQRKLLRRGVRRERNVVAKKLKRKLGHYLFTHSKIVNLYQAESSSTLQEAQAEIKKVCAKVDCFNVASKVQTVEGSFLEGFKICMWRDAKNFPDVDLDLLTNEPDEEADPSNIGATTSPTAELAPEVLEPVVAAPEFAPKLEVMENAPTSTATIPFEVENF
ncbi:hypothetical protein COCNU_scaffold001259G000070 [Cocos nucifera]|nr:hypothetical protein [Cocos nucifera]